MLLVLPADIANILQALYLIIDNWNKKQTITFFQIFQQQQKTWKFLKTKKFTNLIKCDISLYIHINLVQIIRKWQKLAVKNKNHQQLFFYKFFFYFGKKRITTIEKRKMKKKYSFFSREKESEKMSPWNYNEKWKKKYIWIEFSRKINFKW